MGAPNADTVLANQARIHIGEAIRSLEDHSRAVMCPVHDWLVTLKELLASMAHTDGDGAA